MDTVLNINMDAVVRHTSKLERMHKSALPVAIRTALNSAAFDVKKRTMPAAADAAFVKRKPNFFKANSKVEMATGFQIENMRSIVGFKPLSGNNKAVDELEQQEEGGVINNRTLIPMDTARSGGSNQKLVRANARLAALKKQKVIDASKVKSESAKQRFIRAAIKAQELDALVLGNKNGGKRTLSRINSIAFNKKKRTLKIKRTPLYTYDQGRVVRVKATNFMKRASMESGLQLEEHYIKAASKQIQRLRK